MTGTPRTEGVDESVHVVGLSILSGSHVPLVRDVIQRLEDAGASDIPVIVGGIIPEEDRPELLAAGVAEVFTPINLMILIFGICIGGFLLSLYLSSKEN